MGSEKLALLVAEVRAESKEITGFIDGIIAEYTKELDEVISEVEMLITAVERGTIERFTDDELEHYCIKLPALMYRAGIRIEELGAMSDISECKRKDAYNEAMIRVTGTIPEKKAKAEKLIEDKQIVEDIYYRAYTQLKKRLDMAEGVFSGIKKAITKRIKELDLNANSKDGYKKKEDQE